MTTTPPIVVLGGGLMGLAIAHQLARRGHAVRVISRNRNEAAGFVAAGMLAPHAEGLSGQLLTLGERSLALIPQWVAQIEHDSGLTCGLRMSGIVVPFATEDDSRRHPTAALGQSLTRKALEQEVPGLAPHWQAGLLFEQDGQIDNRRQLMRALEKACVSLGVQFLEGAEVQALSRHSDSQELQQISLRTAEGEVQHHPCRMAVLCSGAWSQKLVPELPIFPVKGQMLSLQGPRKALKRVIFGPGTYLVPREDGLIVVGATSERSAGFTAGLTPDGQSQLQAGIQDLLPMAGSWPPMERWWGFRPCTPDEGPLLGPGPIGGLWLACGHHRNGVLLAAITADLLANAITDAWLGAPDDDLLKAFHWGRFQKPPHHNV
ncbi:Aromatic-ring hydroxylase [Synechococcus sp. BL107]|uniref:glycine oxidase ThiO n=1 Tax=Synechococcus sp. BL107 TaxID=313625 RepID=UPI0000E53BEB|nr:glycine oxidase ThiO [Synechococcus sp. BL107]EAU71337.1 Aromatic-ring hydroxylase [Synechococcus sp. BL107]